MALLLAGMTPAMTRATEAFTANCKYGCKVMRCACGYQFVLHYSGYGHRDTSVQHSSTGNRCTC